VVSGGMDNKACVWAARGVTCVDLVGHAASVATVMAGGPGGRQVRERERERERDRQTDRQMMTE
jgi:hypothetical protein